MQCGKDTSLRLNNTIILFSTSRHELELTTLEILSLDHPDLSLAHGHQPRPADPLRANAESG